jgi:glycine cleavage system H protein
MSFEVPDDVRYLESHEWTTVDDATVRVGISDFAQDELGDVVFVELPAVGDEVTAGEAFGVVESIKAVSDLYAPISGTVAAVNEALFDRPELVNESRRSGDARRGRVRRPDRLTVVVDHDRGRPRQFEHRHMSSTHPHRRPADDPTTKRTGVGATNRTDGQSATIEAHR